MMPSRSYLLCGIPRTGSTLLAQALAETGIAGRPIEYFNLAFRNTPRFREILGDSDLVEGLPKILSAGTTPNGMFGAKVFGSHFQHLGIRIATGNWPALPPPRGLLESLRSRLPDVLQETAAHEIFRSRSSVPGAYITAYTFLQSALPDLRIVWLRRKNMVARAISEFRALKTRVWTRPDLEGSPDMRKRDFDFVDIHNLHCLGSFHESSLEQLFQDLEISPHCLFYEELAADYESSVRRVLEFLGVYSEQMRIASPRMKKLSNGLSAEWEERYRTRRAELGFDARHYR